MKKSHSPVLANSIIALCLLITSAVSAQLPGDWKYAVKAGGTNADMARSVATDLVGNTYVVGAFDLTSTFYGTPNIMLTSNGGTDIFLAKYDTAGSVLWAVKAGGFISDAGTGISIDNSGNSYITGNFSDTAMFYGAVNIQLVSNGSNDVFIAKYDPSGNVLWAKKAGGSGADYGNKIEADAAGNTYLTGFFPNDSLIFYGTPNIVLTSGGGNDIFVAKFDPLGNVVWAKHAGGTGNDNGYGIDIDGSGDSYVTGTFLNKAYFYGATLDSVISQGGNDVFVAKFDTNGNEVWVRHAGSVFTDQGNDIAVDVASNCYVTGNSGNSCIFFGPPSNIVLPSNGLSDVFIASYDPSGNLRWVKNCGGPSSDFGNGISYDFNMNYITITGYFQGTANFNGTTVTSSGGADIYVMDWMADGSSSCVTTAGGTGFDRGWDVAGNTSRRYVAGEFAATATFPATPAIAITSAGSGDAFLARWNSGCAIPLGILQDEDAVDVRVYPNPSAGIFNIKNDTNDEREISVFNALGEMIYHHSGREISMQVDLSANADGIYFLQIRSAGELKNERLLIGK